MSRPGRVAVVTVTYNSGVVLDDFLDSLAAQTGIDFEVFAIDNASADDSVNRLRCEARLSLTVIPNADNVGVAEGNNQGIVAALAEGHEWVLLLNNDTMFGPTFLVDLVGCASRGDLPILTPLIEGIEPPGIAWYSNGEIKAWRGNIARHVDTDLLMTQVPAGQLREVDYAPTCALLIRRSVFEAVGLMDPVYFVYFDDADFCLRARRAGFPYRMTTDVRMVHKAGALTGGEESDFGVHWMARNWPLIALRQSRFPMNLVGLVFIQVWMFARLVVGADTVERFRRRQAAFRLGVRAARAPTPGAYLGGGTVA